MNHPLLNHILYINLTSRPDRKEQTIQEFQKLNPPNGIERIPAIAYHRGDMGCAMSHIQCLEIAKERDYPFVFICEDDIQFLQPQLLLENLQKFWDNPPPEGWDVLLIGGNNFKPYERFADYAIHVHFCATTTGYIVARHYYDTLLENFKEGVRLLPDATEREYLYIIDVYWRRLQKPIDSRWYMLTPVTVTQRPSYSDIEKKHVDYVKWMLDIDKIHHPDSIV